MKLIKMILNWFIPKPKIQNFPGKPMDFYRFVVANYKTKTYEQAIREVFRPEVVTLETLKAYKELWEFVVAYLKRKTKKNKKYCKDCRWRKQVCSDVRRNYTTGPEYCKYWEKK